MSESPTLVLSGHPLLEFQPAVDLATGRLLGFEALVRWDHPTRGHISPGILIPWAEANGDIIVLNAWVLTEACRQAQLWPSGIQLAVNCSIVQLRQGEASKAVASALGSSGLNPDRLTIEITEHTIADERAAADLQALTSLGVHLAVDDVGTMWTNLNSLRRFAIETVKIDAAFIANLETDEGMNRAIVDAIVHVGHSLAMSAVAEGVETEEQVAILREFGTDVAQGFFFARPMSSHDTLQLANTDPRPVYPLTSSPTVRPAPAPVRAPDHRTASRGLVLLTNPAATPDTEATGDTGGSTAPAGQSSDGTAAITTATRCGQDSAPEGAATTQDADHGTPAAVATTQDAEVGPADDADTDAEDTTPDADATASDADASGAQADHRPWTRADLEVPGLDMHLPADAADWTDPDVVTPMDGSATA